MVRHPSGGPALAAGRGILGAMIVDGTKNEIILRLVYFGPALSGRSTNLLHVHAHTEPERRTEIASIATETSRTLSFSFKPHTLTPVGGKAIRILLVAAPGSVHHPDSELHMFDAADGVVFVADTQIERLEGNLAAMERASSILADHRRTITDIPFVIQYNKRDLPNRMPLDDLDRRLNPHHLPIFDATATTGVGVFDALEACGKLAYQRLVRLGRRTMTPVS